MGFRIRYVDGPSRISSLIHGEDRLPLPVIIDPGETGNRVFSPKWNGRDVLIQRKEQRQTYFTPHAAELMEKSGVHGMEGAVYYNQMVLLCDGEELDVEVVPLPRLFLSDKNRFSRLLSDYLDERPAHPPLYAPGAADSDNLELLHYLGFEIFDTVRARIDAGNDIFYTGSGHLDMDSLDRSIKPWDICGCDFCSRMESGGPEVELIEGHNIGVMRSRLNESTHHLLSGDLRNHLMGKLANKPEVASAIRTFESCGSRTETDNCRTWRKKGSSLVAYREDLRSPVYRLWERRIREEYGPLSYKDTLLLLPCSARKPYSRSRTHSRIRSYLSGLKGWKDRIQMMVLTSPLGAVPMELEDLYPAAYYDIPVTGTWYPEEVERTRLVTKSVFDKGEYEHVIDFHPDGAKFFPDPDSFFGDADYHPIYGDGERLRETVSNIMETQWSGCSGSSRTREVLNSIRFAQGGAPEYDPGMRILRRRGRTYLSRDRELLFELALGGPKPTLSGGRMLWDRGMESGEVKRVIIDDFIPRGTVFTQGIIDVEGEIHPGDVVVVGTKEEYRGVGRSNLSGTLLTSGISGPGVKMISHRKE